MARDRNISSLRILCLRSIGAHACNAETTFDSKKEVTTASRLLRSFHDRPTKDDSDKDDSIAASAWPPMSRIPCDVTRRANQNEIDLNHPFIATSSGLQTQHGNVALDCLQSYLDSLVELGRLDDTRLGVNFWKEWAVNVNGASSSGSKKRKRSSTPTTTTTTTTSLGSISLHNSSIGQRTIEAIAKSGVGKHFGVLDLTGIHTLHDDLVEQLLRECPNLHRLSLQNCRRLTNASLESVAKHLPHLTCLDVGGSYNMTVGGVLEAVSKLPLLNELYASGMGWSDDTLLQLVEIRPNEWKGLGLAFSKLTAAGIRNSLSQTLELERLSLAFCENSCDSGLLGFLGRSLPKLTVLDVRGNGGVTSMTGFYDGRSHVGAGGGEPQELFVLARYSSISQASIEETKRIHPMQASLLTVVLDSGGCGQGIRR